MLCPVFGIGCMYNIVLRKEGSVMTTSDKRDIQTGNYSDLGYNRKSKDLKPAHVVGVAAVGVVAVIVAFYVLSSLAGVIITVVKLAVIAAIIYAIVKFLTRKKPA